jgi:hypothetical protein
MPGGYFL